jgi:quercetin dioxygenase-like cupin family protein
MEVKKRSSTVRVGPGEGRATRMPGGQLVTRKVSGEQTGGAYSLFEVAVDPGGESAPHVQHREDECFYVLEGAFEFLIEGVKIKASVGSLIYIPKGNLHAFKNVETTTGRMLVSQTPGGLHERFIEEIGEPAMDGSEPSVSEGPQDVRRIIAIAVKYGIEIPPPPDR